VGALLRMRAEIVSDGQRINSCVGRVRDLFACG
jgi:hypothetical protein